MYHFSCHIYIYTQVRAGSLWRVGPPPGIKGAGLLFGSLWIVLVCLHPGTVPDLLWTPLPVPLGVCMVVFGKVFCDFFTARSSFFAFSGFWRMSLTKSLLLGFPEARIWSSGALFQPLASPIQHFSMEMCFRYGILRTANVFKTLLEVFFEAPAALLDLQNFPDRPF